MDKDIKKTKLSLWDQKPRRWFEIKLNTNKPMTATQVLLSQAYADKYIMPKIAKRLEKKLIKPLMQPLIDKCHLMIYRLQLINLLKIRLEQMKND